MYRDPATDLFLKTEQLVYFRWTFALVSVGLAMLVAFLAPGEFHLAAVIYLAVLVALYSLLALVLLRKRMVRHDEGIKGLNIVLVALDTAVLTALVHFTRGIDSDLYFLYLLPILLASHVFGRRGIYLTAAGVSLSYVGLLLAENAGFVSYLIDTAHQEGLAAAYTQRLWVRIFSRSAILVSVAFIWGAFCDHMAGVAQQGANRLREQLKANTRLVMETKAQASREHLINSISSAIRSTLDLDQILQTTTRELNAALKASRCAIVCPPLDGQGEPPIWETLNPLRQDERGEPFSPAFCRFILANRSTYEELPPDGELKKTFVFDEPIREWVFREVRDDLASLQFRSLIVQPIIYAGESKGVLLIGECDERRKWTPSEVELVKAVGGQVAIAIEHARLVNEMSSKNTDLLQKNLHLDAKNLELRQIQSQLIHQEKMASLGRMVAGIAHELNNPVNFVHGNLPYLREYFNDLRNIVDATAAIPQEHTAELEQLKKKVKYDFVITDLDNIIADLSEGAERIRYIIKNLRSFSRLDEAELKEASIQEGIESSLKILNQYYGRDKIPVEVEFEELPPVLCYPGQLNQLWMNLLSNAAQALSCVESPCVKILGQKEGDAVLVSIADNGPGIKAKDQSKIFEPFFTTKPVGQGTGLGLSICHSIIERHGGQIWFDSNPGKGTTFKVKIPLRAHPSELVNPVEDEYDLSAG